MLRKVTLYLIIFYLSLIQVHAKFDEKNLKNSIAEINVIYSYHTPSLPWQKSTPKSRTGQAIAISPYRLITLSSIVENHDLIQIQPGFQTERTTAKVIVFDQETNLCLIEADKTTLKKPFIPIKLSSNINVGKEITLAWLTKNKRFITTNGRIANPEVFFFPKVGAGFLLFNISSDSSPKGPSEPAFFSNKLAGIIEGFDSDKQLSSMIPSDVIISFMERTKKDQYITVPRAGFSFKKLIDNSTRSYLKLRDSEKRGILISDVYDFGSGHSQLKKNDVLLQIGGYDIDPVGNINTKDLENLSFWYFLNKYKTDEKIPALIWRNGKLEEIQILMETYIQSELPIPYYQFPTRPEYSIQGGFVFQEVNLDYLVDFGKDWKSHVDPLIYAKVKKYYFHRFENINKLIVLNHVLRHPINQGYQHLRNRIVTSINGEIIKDLKHLKNIFSKDNTPKYYSILFEGFSVNVVIPSDKLKQANNEIKTIYNIPELEYIKK